MRSQAKRSGLVHPASAKKRAVIVPPDVEIAERYRDWSPPRGVSEGVTRLLDSAPEQIIWGLDTVVLTNASGLSHSERRRTLRSRNQNVRLSDCLGLYHRSRGGGPASIELFIDNIAAHGGPLFSFRVFRDMMIGEVLFHELGHHLHSTRLREFRESEDVADEWRRRLTNAYMRRRYWYLSPLAWIASPLLRLLVRITGLEKRFGKVK